MRYFFVINYSNISFFFFVDVVGGSIIQCEGHYDSSYNFICLYIVS